MRRGVRRPAVMESPVGYIGGGGGGPISAPPGSSTPESPVVKTEPHTPTPHLLDHGYGATPQSQMMPAMPAFSAPAVKRRLNMEVQQIVVPIKHHDFKTPPVQQHQNQQLKRPRRGSPVKKHTRFDTSLGLLTKKFTALLERSPNGVVNLNTASEELGVQKRRIYDITNVLEGIGILEKKSKNNIQWKGGSRGNHGYTILQQEMRALEDRENHLDRLIRSTETELHKLNQNRKYAYVTYQDLHSIEHYKNKTVMAIKAPPDSNFCVPQPPDGDYEIHLKSESGEIDVFLCPENPSPKTKRIPPIDPLLKDYKDVTTMSPALLNLGTPPVPELDSPLMNYQTKKPHISSEVCRSLTFSKDAPFEDTSNESSVNQNSSLNLCSSSLSQSPTSLSAMRLTNLKLTPEDSRNNGNDVCILTSSLFDSEVQEPKSKVSLTPNSVPLTNIADKFSLDNELTLNGGSFESLFNSEPFVPLEPLSHSEFSFSLDQGEGMADLFDFFC